MEEEPKNNNFSGNPNDDDIANARTIQAKPEDINGNEEKKGDGSSEKVNFDNLLTCTEGTKIGKFTLIRKLGKGGMGEVWLARQDSMNREVALKVLNLASMDLDHEFIERFMLEIENTGKMNHPNIITAFDSGKVENLLYLATAYVEGEPLNSILERKGVIPEKEALMIIRHIADALKYAWNSFKIIHRDIKPQNIMIDKNSVPKLMDMGLAKSLIEKKAQLTMTGVILGTPYYMSTEQAMAKKDMDFRVDIYCSGATLYHLVTGKLPYKGKTLMSIIEQVMEGNAPPANQVNPDVSEHCAALIKKMMAKNPEDRHNSWEEVIRDIDLVLDDKPPRGFTLANSGASSLENKQHEKYNENDLPVNSSLMPNLFLIIGVILFIVLIITGIVVLL